MVNNKFIADYLKNAAQIANTISVEDIDKVVEILFNAWKKEKTVFILGNGGSGSTATHFACDLMRTTTTADMEKKFKVMNLTADATLLTSIINDISWESIFVEQLKPFIAKGDVVIGISVHGASGRGEKHAWSQNIPQALSYAKEQGAIAVGLTGFDGGAMKDLCDISVIVPFNKIPNVEDTHLLLGHLISNCLKEKILQSK